MGVEPCGALTAANLVDAGQTVAPGGIITVSSSPISITAGAALAVVGSITQSLVNAAVTQKLFLTFAGPTYTAGDSSDFAIAGQTLTKGGVIKVRGTQSSMGQAGTDVVDGTKIQEIGHYEHHRIAGTYRRVCWIHIHRRLLIQLYHWQRSSHERRHYHRASDISLLRSGWHSGVVGTSTEAVGLGGYIMSGPGPGPSSTAPVQFTWKAARNFLDLWTFCSVLGVLSVYLSGRWHPQPQVSIRLNL